MSFRHGADRGDDGRAVIADPPDGHGLVPVLDALLAAAPPVQLDELLTGIGRDLGEPVRRRFRAIAHQLQDGARREELLRTVSAIAADVTARRDVDGVLHEIVRRTRLLTGSEMAYISLNTADETFIRASDGVRTEEYRTIRMPIGTGVLGKAASGRAIVTTRDYVEDGAIIHLAHIDDIVRGEGVRSILAVPVTVHGAVLGALLVADRAPREYSPEIIDMLDTLAHHTGVALDNARRFEDVTEAIRRLHVRRDADQERMLDLAEVLDLDARLLDSVLEGGGVELFARLVGEQFGSGVQVLDADGVLLASTDAGHDPRPVPAALVRAARETARGVKDEDLSVAAALGGAEHLGTVVVESSLGTRLLPRLQRAAVVLGILVLLDRGRADDRRRRDRAVLEALLVGGRAVDAVRRDASMLGIGAGSGHVLVLVDPLASDAAGVAEVLRQRFGDHRSVVVVHEDHVCVLLPEARSREIESAIAEAGLTVNIGRSRTIGAAAEVPAAHRAALRALTALEALGVRGGSSDGEGLGGVGLVLEALRNDPALPSPLELIAPLLAYDADRGTDLVGTAWEYAETGCSAAMTAQRLHVHVNTVRQRLDRIDRILGARWRDPRHFLDVHLALRMWATAAVSRERHGADPRAGSPAVRHRDADDAAVRAPRAAK